LYETISKKINKLEELKTPAKVEKFCNYGSQNQQKDFYVREQTPRCRCNFTGFPALPSKMLCLTGKMRIFATPRLLGIFLFVR
jgi:hypothetical protein